MQVKKNEKLRRLEEELAKLGVTQHLDSEEYLDANRPNRRPRETRGQRGQEREERGLGSKLGNFRNGGDAESQRMEVAHCLALNPKP